MLEQRGNLGGARCSPKFEFEHQYELVEFTCIPPRIMYPCVLIPRAVCLFPVIHYHARASALTFVGGCLSHSFSCAIGWPY